MLIFVRVIKRKTIPRAVENNIRRSDRISLDCQFSDEREMPNLHYIAIRTRTRISPITDLDCDIKAGRIDAVFYVLNCALRG